MKKIILSIVFVATLITIGHAKWITDNQFKFKINVPDTWTNSSYMDGTDKVYDFYSPDENAAIQLRTFDATPAVTLDVLTQVYEQNMLPAGTQKLSFNDHTSANGIPGKQGVYQMQYNGNQVNLAAFYTIQNSKGYVLTAIIPSSMLAQKGEEVKRITRSFQILGFRGVAKQQPASSNFRMNKFVMGDQMVGKTKITNQTNKFNTQTANIYVVFDWTGNGSGKQMKTRWVFGHQQYVIDETVYNFPNQNGGTSNATICKPTAGWPEGKYFVEFWFGESVVKELMFTVEGGSNSSSGGIGGTIGGSALNNSGSGTNNPVGKYNFLKRSDGQKRVNYHHIEIHPDGSYCEKYQPINSGNYVGGNNGTWSVNGNQLLLKHQFGGITDTYTINGNEIKRTGGSGVIFTFRKQ